MTDTMPNTRTLTEEDLKQNNLKRDIGRIRYEISLAANSPDSQLLLPQLHRQLAKLYDKQFDDG